MVAPNERCDYVITIGMNQGFYHFLRFGFQKGANCFDAADVRGVNILHRWYFAAGLFFRQGVNGSSFEVCCVGAVFSGDDYVFSGFTGHGELV
ncbi:hypothetical protein ES703_57435 [subsurface metagenome]